MTSVNDGLRPHTAPMKKKLETLGVPFVYAEYGEGVPSDSHVFHLNLYSENGKRRKGRGRGIFMDCKGIQR